MQGPFIDDQNMLILHQKTNVMKIAKATSHFGQTEMPEIPLETTSKFNMDFSGID